MRYGTPKAWAEYYEKEGVKIDCRTILKRLHDAEMIGRNGRSKMGIILKNAFYSEIEINEACPELNGRLPQANKDGFLVNENERYGTIYSLSGATGISTRSIESRIKTYNLQSIKGRICSGNICDFYSESEIRKICTDLLDEIPQADESGFIIIDNEKYGTITGISKKLGISDTVIKKGIIKYNLQSVIAKDKGGRIRNLYSESEIRQIYAHLLEDLPQADDDGFFVKEGIKYGTIQVFSRFFHVSRITISSRLKKFNLKGMKGKELSGNICIFYPEIYVRNACADIFLDVPQANEDNFIEKDGIKYRTICNFAKLLLISIDAITLRLKRSKKQYIKGKTKLGRFRNFYSEPDVLEACADILAKRKSDTNNPQAT